ncbi:MAG: aminoacyl-tRNA hydrolase [Candidatus Magasanikbacteria bacterium]
MKLIIGLGNPGKNYIKTRHNVGFMILDALREKLDSSDWSLSKKFNAETSGCVVKGEKIILAKPMTFMNASGQAVQLITHFYKFAPVDIIVVHDDKDLKLGDVRVQEDRGAAGHNGVQSIIDHIGTQKFTRIRIGVASENEKKMRDTAKFVLNKFGYFEKKKVEEVINRSVEEIEKLI